MTSLKSHWHILCKHTDHWCVLDFSVFTFNVTFHSHKSTIVCLYIQSLPYFFFFSPTCLKAQIYSNKFFNNFHLFEPSFTFPGLRAAGLVQRLYIFSKNVEMAIKDFTNTSWWPLTSDIWLSDLFKEICDIFDVQLTCAKIKVNSTL